MQGSSWVTVKLSTTDLSWEYSLSSNFWELISNFTDCFGEFDFNNPVPPQEMLKEVSQVNSNLDRLQYLYF